MSICKHNQTINKNRILRGERKHPKKTTIEITHGLNNLTPV